VCIFDDMWECGGGHWVNAARMGTSDVQACARVPHALPFCGACAWTEQVCESDGSHPRA
jgi:hypothetical protein